MTKPNDLAKLTPKELIDDPKTNDNQDPPIVFPPEDVIAPVSVENHHEERQPPPPDAQATQASNLLSLRPIPMGRSSR